MSDFSGLYVAYSGLTAARRGIDVTGNNITNVNTDGYSRRRLELVSESGPTVPAIWSRFAGAGSGVRVADVTRFRDQFLEVRAALEHGAQQHLDRVNTVLQRLERLLAEPGDTGIAAQLTTFWSSFDEVANNPSSTPARVQLLERASTLANTFRHLTGEIGAMRTEAVNQLQAMIADVNAKADTVAQLNQAIKSTLVAGLDAGDLLDRRDKLAQEVAGQVGAQIRPGEFGSVTLVVGGSALVSDSRAEHLTIDDSGPALTIRWEKDGFPATIASGAVGGMLETVNEVLPGYRADLDTIAMRLRDDVNALHGGVGGTLDVGAQDLSAAGSLAFDVSLDGGAFTTVSVAGADWSGTGGAAALQAALQASVDAALGAGGATVTVTGGDGSPLAVSVTPPGGSELRVRAMAGNAGFATLLGSTAVGLDGIGGRAFFGGTDAATLSVAIAGNPDAVAAGTAAGGPLSGSRALDLAELGSSPTGTDTLYRSFVVALGVDAQTTAHRLSIQTTTTSQVDSARESISGVDIDQEMVGMVQFQHAYDAAARYLTAVDEMLSTLIQRTGRVGL
jgi:flagellar hook-associated protein FlgK